MYAPQEDGSYKVVFEKLRALSNEDEDFLAGIVKGKPWGTGPKDFMRKMFDGCVDACKIILMIILSHYSIQDLI